MVVVDTNGAGHGAITPFKGRSKPVWKKQINSERANAELKK